MELNGKLSEHLKIVIQVNESDIGGTNTAGSDDTAQWISLVGVKRALCLALLGTWNAADDLDTFKIEQASDSAGTGKKDLTTSSATGDYDTDTPIDAKGEQILVDLKPSDLDIANGFDHVRAYGAEEGNSGVDNVSFMWVLFMEEAYPQRSGAASAALQYINAD